MWSSILFRRVFIAFAALIVISAVLFAVLVSRSQEEELRTQLMEQLRVSSILLGSMAAEAHLSPSVDGAEHAARLQDQVRELGRQTQTRFTWIAADGRVLADSTQEEMAAVNQMEDHRQRQEIREALNEGTGHAQRYSSTLKEPHFYNASRVDRDGEVVGVARSSIPVHTIQRQVRQGRLRVWAFTAIVAAAALASTRYLLARIIAPLLTLTRAVDRMKAGHLGEHVEITNRDEIGTLAQAFNELSDDLFARIEQLRERGDQLAAVLGGLVEGVIAVDHQAHVMFANDAAGRLFDFDAHEAHDRPLVTLIRDETLRQSFDQALKTGDVVNAEIKRHLPSSGALAVHATPLPGSPCPGVVLVLYDLTQLRRLESLRQEFVANVSHELKTPLSAIKAYAETLRSGAINDENHNLEFVRRIEDQADRLYQLIMDLLSLARIESSDDAYEIGDVDVQQAVADCVAEYRNSAESRDIRLLSESPAERLVVRADDEAVRQILDNLVNNAIKYTPAEGQVIVRWKRKDDFALIEVVDTGVGIDRTHLDRLFERFYRVDKARSRELGGTGLGLSIVKHLAQFFGGNVGVESQIGQGSRFWVLMPLA